VIAEYRDLLLHITFGEMATGLEGDAENPAHMTFITDAPGLRAISES